MKPDFLAEMAAVSRDRVAQARARCPERELRARVADAPAPPPLRLSPLGFDLITEVKLRSPAAGVLRDAAEDIAARVRGYAAAGAAAVSVLTEPTRFDGALTHLERASAALAGRIPTLRKDFIVDPYQLLEARAAGAGGVLVILRMLPGSQTSALLEAAARLGLFVLLEAFDEADIERAARLVDAAHTGARLLLGVNCRDLATLQVMPGRLEALAARLPQGVPWVAESGLTSAADATRLAAAGYGVALVGGALMQADDPQALARELLASGRGAFAARAGAAAMGRPAAVRPPA